VVRGGGWNNNDNNLRAANRNNNEPDNANNNIGFRCVAGAPGRFLKGQVPWVYGRK
jgi:formylglycine-generating enzyme required for sulfatase activity